MTDTEIASDLAIAVALSPALPEITPEIFTSASAIVGIRGSGKTNDGVALFLELGDDRENVRA